MTTVFERVVPALHELPKFAPGDRVKVGERAPIGHYRVPIYLRGKVATVVQVIEPALVDNEEEGYGRNAGDRRHYYRIALPLAEIWSEYQGRANDELRIEVYETWLENA